MLFKLDQNMHDEIAVFLRSEGHDAMTVLDQGMSGFSDPAVAQVCREEHRILLTQDLDFTNTLRFRPDDYAGIIVLRLRNQSLDLGQLTAVKRLLLLLERYDIARCLWIVDDHRVRIRRPRMPY